jgi:outer membrane protein OmpA-like peptidoglycan-associated protein
MKYTISILTLSLIMLSSAALLGQSREERRVVKEENTFARQQEFGFGLGVGLHQFTGDVQDKEGGFFEGAENNLLFGGNLLAKYRVGGLKNIGTLHLLGRAGFHPIDGSVIDGVDSYEFDDNVIQIDIGVQLELLPQSDVRPFGNLGAGLIFFDPTVTKSGKWLTRHQGEFVGDGTATFAIPVELGLLFTVSDNLDLMAYVNKTIAFSDNLDGWVSNINDNWQSFNVGAVYFFGSDEEEVIEIIEPVKPVKKDTDGDGLLDEDEVNIYKTDPTNKDTDGDGCNDGQEVLKMKTKPLVKDTDGDGLNDCDEVNTHRTDPLRADTDRDGCSDGREVLTMKTKPLVKDTDGDGLTDCDEVNKYKTNPLIVDTDGDGALDGREVAVGTDPLVADVLKLEEGKNIVLEGINFETAKATILPVSEEILTKALNTLKVNEEINVEIQGHTDDRGKDKYNQRLSEARANSVVNWLVERGIAPTRLSALGYGEKSPMVPNNTADNRAKNRRIEFKILK